MNEYVAQLTAKVGRTHEEIVVEQFQPKPDNIFYEVGI